MMTSDQFKSKVHFNAARGYTLLGVKYGLRIINSIFDTLYVIVMPNQEEKEKTVPIYAVSRGTSISMKPDMADVNDVIVLVGQFAVATDKIAVNLVNN